ncbi:hypothetical protein Glove_19g402 [Diversispora epigaea]|uniref:Uncharacterized protein n=1 Tax=Diversispora epigaea TaxID=1348612 RepID=A0A397JN48_9GLOM|nr:hypothetical protein Glove_19g402 [Diversispora epigaea]
MIKNANEEEAVSDSVTNEKIERASNSTSQFILKKEDVGNALEEHIGSDLMEWGEELLIDTDDNDSKSVDKVYYDSGKDGDERNTQSNYQYKQD